MRKNQKGSLTVEACISLTIFLMVFVTILYIMRLVFAYEVVQHAVNQTAKEFSTYSYYLGVSGLGDINSQINSSTAGGKAKFNENVTNVVNVYNSFSDLAGGVADTGSAISGGDLSDAISSAQGLDDNYNAFKQTLGPAKGTIESIVNDPMSAIKSVGSVLVSGGNEAAKSFLCGEISRALMAKYIAGGNYETANKRLEDLRIMGGLDGLDFSGSKFWSAGSEETIELVVFYTIDPVFPIDVIDELNFVNRATVRGWSGKSIF